MPTRKGALDGTYVARSELSSEVQALLEGGSFIDSKKLEEHEVDTTNVHGIVDTTKLALKSEIGGGLPWLNVETYGAKGDNSTDDAAAFTSAVTAAPATGAVIVVPPGKTYKLASTVACGTKPIIWILWGATLRRSTEARMITYTGSVGADANLTANVAASDVILKFNTTGYAVGDYLNLRSTKSTGAPSGSTLGEVVQVKKVISGTELEIREPCADAYATADTAKVAKFSFMSGATIYGGKFTQNEALTKNVENGYVNYQYCVAAVIEDTVFETMEEFGLQFDASINCRGRGLIFRNHIFDEPNERFGYGIVMRGPCQDISVSGCLGESAQIANGGGSTRGYPRYCRFADCKASGAPNTIAGAAKAPFSLHSDCAFWTYANCEVDGWGDIGFQVKGNDHQFIGCRVLKTTGVGFFFVADSATIFPERCRISDITIVDVKKTAENIGIGIAVQGVGHTIDGAYIADVDAHGISVNRSASAEACNTHQINNPVIRNWSRSEASVYNGVRLGPTGVTGVTVRNPLGIKPGNGARLVRFEGESAGNTGCRIIAPYVLENAVAAYGEGEYYAIEGLEGSGSLTAEAEIKPNVGQRYIEVSGATGITKIKKTKAGHVIILNFLSTPKVTRGENIKIERNFLATVDSTLALICGGSNWYEIGRGNQPPSAELASAATITVAQTGPINFVKVSGANEIKKIEPTYDGHVIVIKWGSTAKLVQGENLKITATIEPTENDTTMLVCDGTNWYTVSEKQANP